MRDDSQQSGQFKGSWASRRRFIQAAGGAAGITGLAGCQGDTSDSGKNGGSTTASGNGQSSGQPVDPKLTLDSLGVPASDVQWNEFNFSNYKWMVQAHIMDPFAVWDPANSEFVGLLAKDWTVDTKNQKLQVKLNKDYKWHDGKKTVRPVTAKDVYTHFQMEQHMGWSSSEYTKEIKEVDKHTVEFILKGGYENKDFIRFNLLTNVLSHGLPQYREWVQKFDKAGSQKAKDKFSQKLSEVSIPTEEMYSYGPFAAKDASRQNLTCVKNPGHPAADKINFPKLVFRYVGSEQKLWQSLSNGQLDGHVRMNVPKDVRSGFPSHVERTTVSSLGGLSLAFTWKDDVVSDPRVRQAIGYVIDRQTVAENAGADTHQPVTLNTGLATKYNDDYLDSSKYIKYDKNHQKATRLLKDAGFTKNGKQWMTPSGKEFGPDIKTGTTGGPDLLALQTVTSQLKQFGIDTQLRTMEATSFEENIWNQGDFRIASAGWGADYPQPYAWYNNTFVENRDKTGMPSEISTPPVGEPNGPQGSLTMNLDTAVNNLTKFNGEKLKKQTRELAWAYDFLVPQLQIYESRDQTWFSNDDWNYPSLDSDIMQRRFYTPFHYILKTGKFTAKTK
ncbi:ABC transporter substrate-binding protein [Haladaptatus salinisoli]|uniref:ABC transporter substrate-binding protein n=1 Tax=Haladaptatus salinisoli TaxID=2884876 RepID=UPI001D0BCABE|nr:ABC transporter substrate-binding protein [Haladaptatus salinisoli]